MFSTIILEFEILSIDLRNHYQSLGALFLRLYADDLSILGGKSRIPRLSSNLVNYALMKRFLSVDVKYIDVNPEIYTNFLKKFLFLV